MKRFLFFFSILLATALLSGCAQQPATLQEEIEALHIPHEYVVTQSGTDTGFAGAQGTGAYNETRTFTVKDEAVNTTTEHMSLLRMSDIAAKLQGQEMAPLNDTPRCYEHEQWGVERITACFSDHKIVSYQELRTLGNHQTRTLSWDLHILD